MPLEWSEPRPPTKNVCRYDHVVAATPLGPITIEWKSWKSPGEGYVAEMPWNHVEVVVGNDLEDAKRLVQASWDAMADKIVAIATKV